MIFPEFINNKAADIIKTSAWELRGRNICVVGTNITLWFYAIQKEVNIMEQHNINILLGLPYGTTE